MPIHPLAQLSREEIRYAAQLIKKNHASDSHLVFKAITLQEPDKIKTLAYLDKEHRGESPESNIDRSAFLNYYLKGGVRSSSAQQPSVRS